MFRALILICSLTTPGADCDQHTALMTIHGQYVRSDVACIQQSEIEMARHVGELPPESYLKITCVRDHEREAQK